MGVVDDVSYEKTKRRYLIGAGAIILALAVSGSVDRTAGGVIWLVAMVASIFALHRLGRAGSRSRS